MKKNILIVGQGLAGTVMAFSLLSKGHQVQIISHGMPGAASPSAIGVLNPIILKKLRPIWMIEECAMYASSFYSETIKLTGSEWFHKMNVLKRLHSQSEHNDWLIKSETESLKKYLGPIVEFQNDSFNLNASYGWGQVDETAWVDIPEFITAAKNFFVERNMYRSEKFDYDSIVPGKRSSYKAEFFDKIIFCEGWQLKNNPYFKNIPMIPAKGDNIKIHYPNHGLTKMLKQKYFIVPINSDQLLCGSSFEWDFENVELSEIARDLIIETLNVELTGNFEVIGQASGVRPTTKDRRALLGTHKDFVGLFLFNGLGTRGLLLAPYLAEMAIQHMFSNEPLNPEVDINRFLD